MIAIRITDLREILGYTQEYVADKSQISLEDYIAYEKDEVDLIQSMTRWARALPNMTLPHDNMHPTGFIIICQDTEISNNLARYQKDIGIVAQTILLQAVEDGLGGCMIGNFTPKEVKEKLSLDEKLVYNPSAQSIWLRTESGAVEAKPGKHTKLG